MPQNHFLDLSEPAE